MAAFLRTCRQIHHEADNLDDYNCYGFLKALGHESRQRIQKARIRVRYAGSLDLPSSAHPGDCKNLQQFSLKIQIPTRSRPTWSVREATNAQVALSIPLLRLSLSGGRRTWQNKVLG